MVLHLSVIGRRKKSVTATTYDIANTHTHAHGKEKEGMQENHSTGGEREKV
jgi:hypothetical protein